MEIEGNRIDNAGFISYFCFMQILQRCKQRELKCIQSVSLTRSQVVTAPLLSACPVCVRTSVTRTDFRAALPFLQHVCCLSLFLNRKFQIEESTSYFWKLFIFLLGNKWTFSLDVEAATRVSIQLPWQTVTSQQQVWLG